MGGCPIEIRARAVTLGLSAWEGRLDEITLPNKYGGCIKN